MPVNSTEPRHPVRVAAQKSGVTPHVLRAWERRYRVVTPVRTEGGQRLYSDVDVDRLRLLRRLTARGHGIGQLAKLSDEELGRIAQEEPFTDQHQPGPPSDGRVVEYQSATIRAAQRLDGGELQSVLERAAVSLGVPIFLEEVAGPSLKEIGHAWENGTISVGQEHLATAVFRRVLGWIIDTYESNEPSPRILVATLPGERHELGALLAGAAAASERWDVLYLGADLPASEVLSAAEQAGVQAVALSIVMPTTDATLIHNLRQIRQELPPQVHLFLGGAAVEKDPERFRVLGARIHDSLGTFRTSLRELKQLTA